MYNKFPALVLALLFFVSCSPLKKSLRQEFTVVSYNVENLFDTIDDPRIPDEEFLPESEKQWDSRKYQKKLEDISRAITEANQRELPEIIGLVEIENRQVLDDLVRTENLGGRYGIVHEDSPDFRGIDVALLYRTGAFKLKSYEVLPVNFPESPEFKTRDILHVTGEIRNKVVHIFVNHWPSRIGGNEATEPKRVLAASVLKNKVEQLFADDSNARVIIMGDMNDCPSDKSLSEILGAKKPGTDGNLINLMAPDEAAGKGSYFYRNNWNMLDNIVVSRNVFEGRKMQVENRKGFIISSDWMIFTNKNGDKTPNRTYVGNKYTGGPSDHFPVYFKMIVK